MAGSLGLLLCCLEYTKRMSLPCRIIFNEIQQLQSKAGCKYKNYKNLLQMNPEACLVTRQTASGISMMKMDFLKLF
jgi:hypothetical protein